MFSDMALYRAGKREFGLRDKDSVLRLVEAVEELFGGYQDMGIDTIDDFSLTLQFRYEADVRRKRLIKTRVENQPIAKVRTRIIQPIRDELREKLGDEGGVE